MTRSIWAGMLLIALTPRLGWSQSNEWQDPADHVTRAVVADPFVLLEVLDYGGTGETLVFLAGLGNSAHVFDEFAPRFTDRYRVFAISRRGYGASSRPAVGYDLGIRTRDIVTALDDLGVRRAIFAGHSIAGDELSALGAEYGSRVLALIYLDAGDYGVEFFEHISQLPSIPQAAPPQMVAADSASLAAYSAYRLRAFGVTYPEAETRVHSKFVSGRYAGSVSRPDAEVLGGTAGGAWRRIAAPALGIYPTLPETVHQRYPGYDSFDTQNRANAERSFQLWETYVNRLKQRFTSELPRPELAEVPGAHHYIFLSNPDEVERLMRRFLRDALGG